MPDVSDAVTLAAESAGVWMHGASSRSDVVPSTAHITSTDCGQSASIKHRDAEVIINVIMIIRPGLSYQRTHTYNVQKVPRIRHLTFNRKTLKSEEKLLVVIECRFYLSVASSCVDCSTLYQTFAAVFFVYFLFSFVQ